MNAKHLKPGPTKGRTMRQASQAGRSHRMSDTRSDIGLADPNRYPVAAVDPASGGRQRAPHPEKLEPHLVTARPNRSVGFIRRVGYTCGRCLCVFPGVLGAWAHANLQTCFPPIRRS